MASPDNKVPFFLAGDGAYLRFRTADLLKLREIYGEPKVIKDARLGEVFETFTDRIDQHLMLVDVKVIVDCLKVGLKQEDGVKPFTGVSFDDLPFGLSEAVQVLRDAIVLAITGKTYAALIQTRRDAAAAEADEDPLIASTGETSSSEPSGPGTAQDS